MEPRRKWMSRRLNVVAVMTSLLIGVAGFVTAPVAAAYEGECSGSFSNFPDNAALPCIPPAPYYWYDSNSDNSSTDLHLVNCSANPDIALQRSSNGSTGWTNVGAPKRFWCLNTDGGWKGWGDQPAGYYRFVIDNPRSSDNLLDVGYVHIAW